MYVIFTIRCLEKYLLRKYLIQNKSHLPIHYTKNIIYIIILVSSFHNTFFMHNFEMATLSI